MPACHTLMFYCASSSVSCPAIFSHCIVSNLPYNHAGAADVTATSEVTTHDTPPPCLTSQPCEEATNTTITITSSVAAGSAKTPTSSTATSMVALMEETAPLGVDAESAASSGYNSSIEGMPKSACVTPQLYGLAVGAPLVGDNMDATKAGECFVAYVTYI
jgi:hypothetical protein